MRTSTAWVVVASATAALLAGCSSPEPGPIRTHRPVIWSDFAKQGAVFTDGMDVINLAGDKYAKIKSVEFVGADGLELVGVKLAKPDRGIGSIQKMEWPPKDPQLPPNSVVDVEGTYITPAKPDNTGTWELLLGVKVTGEGHLVRKAVKINYTVAGKNYSRTLPSTLVVCTSRKFADRDGNCPFPNGWNTWTADDYQ